MYVSIVAEYAEKLGVPISLLTGERNSIERHAEGEHTNSLNCEEQELITIYRDLNDLGQQALLGTARGLAANPDMKKLGASNIEAI